MRAHERFFTPPTGFWPLFEPFLDFDPVLEEPLSRHELPIAGRERRPVMHDLIFICQPDLLRLAEALRQSRRMWAGLDSLETKLKEATVVPVDELPEDVVRMGSTAIFRDVSTDVVERYRLVYPEEADLDQKRLSVFAPIGTALLGGRLGSTVWWDSPSGKRGATIQHVDFEPQPCDGLIAS
jgi:regulator of nucleoside diphosphate kinase